MRAFIVRPFGVKQGIDFDAMEAALIAPALAACGVAGSTTGEITAAGNIRVDMFQLLLTADLVICDISVHNANVFYELGIRHALRDHGTILIRGARRGAEPPPGDVPFDLRTDRYLAYDLGDPAAALDALCATIHATRVAERPDSPVYGCLPELVPPPPVALIPVPRSVRDLLGQHVASHRAGQDDRRGDLRLLACDVAGAPWELEAWRLIGRGQLNLKDTDGARETWERVRGGLPTDLEANQRLATLYQRAGSLAQSDQAIWRAQESNHLPTDQRAELHALSGRNAKARWRKEWDNSDLSLTDRRTRALRSTLLEEALAEYRKGFLLDLNHFYSGLNALALARLHLDLAVALPDGLQEIGDDSKEQVEADIGRLESAVDLALAAAELQGPDDWVAVSRADWMLLCGKPRAKVLQAYRKAVAALSPFAVGSAATQLELFERLELLPEAPLAEVLAIVRGRAGEPAPADKVLVFSGHLIDAPTRQQPRFPADREPAAREAIREAVAHQVEEAEGRRVVAFSGAGSGGDLLFLEACQEAGVQTHVLLAMPSADYVAESVSPAGGQWEARFRTALAAAATVRELPAAPEWLQGGPSYSVWARGNLWIMQHALAQEGALVLITLWDGKPGDGPGGTEHMVELARARGAAVVHLGAAGVLG